MLMPSVNGPYSPKIQGRREISFYRKKKRNAGGDMPLSDYSLINNDTTIWRERNLA